MIEVLVAVFILAMGIIGAMGVFMSAAKGTYAAERSGQGISLAERELERLAATPFSLLELDSYPTVAASGPGSFVSGANFRIAASYSRPPAEATLLEPLVVDPDANPAADGTSIVPVSVNVAIGPPGGPTATVYRFITRRDESCPVLGLLDACPAEQGSKRLTIAVIQNQTGNGVRPRPVYASTVVTDPSVAPLDLPL
jgi:hypothetical protein